MHLAMNHPANVYGLLIPGSSIIGSIWYSLESHVAELCVVPGKVNAGIGIRTVSRQLALAG
jgi:hypothetical protein